MDTVDPVLSYTDIGNSSWPYCWTKNIRFMPAVREYSIRLEFISSGLTCDESILVMIVRNVHNREKATSLGHASVLLSLKVRRSGLKQGVSSFMCG